MPQKLGRPIKGAAKRDRSLQLRMSSDELSLLDECSTRLNLSRTDTINKGIRLVKIELDDELKK